MTPDLESAPPIALLACGISFLVMTVASSWPVVLAAGAVGLVSMAVILKSVGPSRGHAPALAPREAPEPGTVALIDRNGMPHEQLAYHRIAEIRCVSDDGAIATSTKFPSTLFPLRRARVCLNGDRLDLRRRGARRIEVIAGDGRRVATVERLRTDAGGNQVRATGGSTEEIHRAATAAWAAPQFVAPDAAGAVAQALVLAGVEGQLRSLTTRLLTAL